MNNSDHIRSIVRGFTSPPLCLWCSGFAILFVLGAGFLFVFLTIVQGGEKTILIRETAAAITEEGSPVSGFDLPHQTSTAPAAAAALSPELKITPEKMNRVQKNNSLPLCGEVIFPYRFVDAGNYFMQAGALVILQWDHPPAEGEQYIFVYLAQSSAQEYMVGIDTDDQDGIAVEWKVPEGISGKLSSYVQNKDGQKKCISSAKNIFSGTAPPQRVCSISSSNISPLKIYPEKTLNSTPFAELFPGEYAQVLESSGDGWLLINAIESGNYFSNQFKPEKGWIFKEQAYELFGNCGAFEVDAPE